MASWLFFDRDIIFPDNNVISDMNVLIVDGNQALVIPGKKVLLHGSVLDGDMAMIIMGVVDPFS